MSNNKKTSLLLSASVCVALLSLAACNKKPDAAAPAATPQAAPAPAPAYAPPTADQLYQLVGPIALFPDKLVAQVLAASSYPDQVAAADNWLAQNKNLKGKPLQDAANQQPWDVSVKGLTQFPGVLDQMAHNIAWTSALGDAYVNDPADVMNAIQVMRQRAAASGNLKSNKQQHIATAPRVQAAPPLGYAPPPNEPVYYTGPEMVPPPPQTIVIEPADSGVVYVPAYNPAVVYGQPLPVYPGYSYAPPPAYYPPGEIITAGVLTFGLGIAVGALVETHHWGWNSWGMHWGGGGGGGNWNGGGPNGWHRPAVVYNNNTYVSRSTTIVNRVTNNYNSTVINNNTRNHFAAPNPVQPGGGAANFNAARPNFSAPGNPQQGHSGQNAPSFAAMPRGNHGPADFSNMARPNFAAPGNPQQVHPGSTGASFVAVPGGNHGLGDFSNMTRPNFSKNPATSGPLAAANTNQLLRREAVHTAQNQQPDAAAQRPGAGEAGQHGRAMHELQQNSHVPAAQHSPENVHLQANLNQHAFGGNHAAATPQPTPAPAPAPQNVQNRPHQQFDRPNGGQQMHQEMNRPAPEVHHELAPTRTEPRPQAEHQPHPHPQNEHHEADHQRSRDREEKHN